MSESKVIRGLRIVNPFATYETTFRISCGAIVPAMGTNEEIARRLIALRKHFKIERQADFAAEIGLAPNIYNPFEKATRPLTMDAARRIRRRFGISVDWLLFGDVGQPGEAIARELGPEPAEKIPYKHAKKPSHKAPRRRKEAR